MRFPLFLVGAIVLTVFAIIAGAQPSGIWWVTTYFMWFLGAFLSLLVHYLLGAGTFGAWDGYLGPRRTVVQQAPPA